jgi:hypothetical protein
LVTAAISSPFGPKVALLFGKRDSTTFAGNADVEPDSTMRLPLTPSATAEYGRWSWKISSRSV